MSSGGDKVRVLWLTKGLGPGGAERLLLSFAALADHERFEIHAAHLLPWKDHLVADLEARGVEVHCLEAPRPHDPRWLARLRALVRDRRIQIVHDHSPLVAGLARPAVRALPAGERPALVGTEHNVWHSHHRLTRIANRATLALEQHTFAVSEQVRSSMPPRARRRTEVLIHGVDVDAIRRRRGERDEARARLGVEPDTLCVVAVANLRANKDYPTMLAAARQLVDDGVDVTFLAVGQGPLEDELGRRHRELGLGDRFRFLGYQSDPIGVLAAGDAFCLSSRFEGLSIALLEAMAMGLPPVVTNVGGTPSVVADGVHGLLVEPGAPAQLSAAIASLTDAAARRRLSAAAGDRSVDFSMQHAVDRQQAIYRSLA